MRPEPDAGDRSASRRRALVEISPEGRLAGYTTAASLIVMSAAYLIASWDELTCRASSGCTQEAGKAGLVWFTALLAASSGIVIAWTIHRRPTQPEGASGWTWGLTALFTAGAWVAVTRIPSLTCPVGYHLDVGFRLCIASADRFDATSWAWLKTLLWSASALVAVTVIRSPRSVPWSAAVAAVTWSVGLGWFLYDTLLVTVR
ncbi:MAG TPA: hypothetical protein VF984_05640 [Actinomycetota bacterium]